MKELDQVVLTSFSLLLSFNSRTVPPVVIQSCTSPLVVQPCRSNAIVSCIDANTLTQQPQIPSVPGASQFAILRILSLILLVLFQYSVDCCLASFLLLSESSLHYHWVLHASLIFQTRVSQFFPYPLLYSLHVTLHPILDQTLTVQIGILFCRCFILISLQSGSFFFDPLLKFFSCSFTPFPFDSILQMIQPCLLTFLSHHSFLPSFNKTKIFAMCIVLTKFFFLRMVLIFSY